MWIMVAGPYASGTADEAIRAARSLPWNRAALALFRLGHVPVIGVNLALPLIAEAGSEACDEIMLPLSLPWPSAAMPACALAAFPPARMRRFLASRRAACRFIGALRTCHAADYQSVRAP